MKLNEVIAKYGNQEVDESKIKEVLGVKESKVWKPENGDGYWFVHANGDTCYTVFIEKNDKKMVNFGNVYKTKEEAEFARDKQIFLTRFERYLRENEDEPVNWSSEREDKRSLALDYRSGNVFTCGWIYTCHQGSIYTTNEKALKEIGRAHV